MAILESDMKKLLFVVLLSVLISAFNLAHGLQLAELTLEKTQQKLRSGEITMAQLLSYYVKRIERFDNRPNGINSIARFSPDIEMQINKLQQKLNNSEPLGSLFGAFVLVKDNIDVVGMPNTAGSWLLREHIPSSDAFIIQKLKQQDAIILAKTNLSEWANFRSNMSSSGWSSLYGQTRNPHDVTRSPCGSSSGSGAAIAADFGLLAIGTETDGSMICPSSVNGIVGFKPSLGLVSRSGIIPIAHSQDTAGPMARNVEDAYALFKAMLGKDQQDEMSIELTAQPTLLGKKGLQGKRIGVVRNLMGYHPKVDELFEKQLSVLKSAGAIIIDNTPITTRGKWGKYEYIVLKAEFKADLNKYLKQSQAPISSLKQAISLNQKNAAKTMPIFGQEILIESMAAPSLEDDLYLDALANSKRLAAKEGIDATMKQHKLDLLIAPSGAPAWKIDHINGDHFLGSASSAAAVSGYPHITVPMGAVDNMPVGMSFFSGFGNDVLLFEVALDFESRSRARLTPKLQ